MEDIIYLDVSRDIILLLFSNKVLRSTDLEKKLKGTRKISSPTIYFRLKELVDGGFVEKITISKRNVQYRLTLKGESAAKKECGRSTESLLFSLRNSTHFKDLVIQCLVLDIIEESPAKFQTAQARVKLKALVAKEIELIKQKILDITSLNYW